MSYETAPATKLLATRCACCGRPLLDAASVEAGMGPVCRAKHGYAEAQAEPDWRAVLAHTDGLVPLAEIFEGYEMVQTEAALALDTRWRLGGLETRRVANLLVHRVAARHLDSDGDIRKGEDTYSMIDAIRALGFTKLAGVLAARCVLLLVEVDSADLSGRYLAVTTPYLPEVAREFRAVPGRRWDAARKVNVVPEASRRAVWNIFKRHFPGLIGSAPTGMFVVPRAA